MSLEIDARFDDFYAFGFEELFLERGVGFTDEDFAALANDAMPGNALSRWCGGHSASGGARATREAQSFG